MSAYPSLPLFTDAFIADTSHLSAQETGAYLLLLMVAWRSPECRLPDDDARLARYARVDRRTWQRIRGTILEFWTLSDGFWTQKRLSREREIVSKRAEAARENGKQGGRPKSLNNKDAANPLGSSQVSETKAPNPSPISNVERIPDPIGSAAVAAAEPEKNPRQELFGRGKATVARITGRALPSAGSLIGRWLKIADDSAVIVLAAIDDAAEADLANPVPWIEQAIRKEAQRHASGSHDLFQRQPAGGGRSGTVNAAISAALVRRNGRGDIGPGGWQNGTGPEDRRGSQARHDDPDIPDAEWTPAPRYSAAH